MTTEKDKTTNETNDTSNEAHDTTNEKHTEAKDDQNFWDDTRENVAEGARIVGEEAKRIGGQISSYSEKIFGKVSDSATDAYKISTEFTRDAVNAAQALAEKYKDKYEINKLNNKKKEISTQLGMKLYLDVKNNENRIPRGFLDKNEIKGLVSNLEKLDQEIIDITKEDEKQS